MRGFGSKACSFAALRRFEGNELSVKFSTKSLTMKFLLEKVSRVKVGALGKMDLPPGGAPAMACTSQPQFAV
jgi:hypothetical protein